MMNKLINDIVQKAINELKKDSNREVIENEILNPLLMFSLKKIYPYFIFLGVLFGAILILAVIILYILTKRTQNVTVEFK